MATKDLIKRLRDARRDFAGVTCDIIKRIAELEAEVAALRGSPLDDHASMFWDAADPDRSYETLSEVIDDYRDGEIVEVLRGAALPSVFAVLIQVDEDGDREVQVFASAGEAEAFIASARAA